MPIKAILGSQAVELEAYKASFIHGPVQKFWTTLKYDEYSRHDIEPRIAVELRRKNLRLQVLVEYLAQHLFIKAKAVEHGPNRGRPTQRKRGQLLGKLEQVWHFGIDKLIRSHPSDRQGLLRWGDMRHQAVAKTNKLDFPEFRISKEGREL